MRPFTSHLAEARTLGTRAKLCSAQMALIDKEITIAGKRCFRGPSAGRGPICSVLRVAAGRGCAWEGI